MDRVRWFRGLVLAAVAAGFVFAPAVHLAVHDRPHHHDGDVVHDDEDHDHEDDHDGDHEDDHDHPAPFDPDHGRNSIAHLSAASGGPADSSLHATCCDLVFLGHLSVEESAHLPRAPRATHRVRGPPPV
jgi:hypothetical protein